MTQGIRLPTSPWESCPQTGTSTGIGHGGKPQSAPMVAGNLENGFR